VEILINIYNDRSSDADRRPALPILLFVGSGFIEKQV